MLVSMVMVPGIMRVMLRVIMGVIMMCIVMMCMIAMRMVMGGMLVFRRFMRMLMLMAGVQLLLFALRPEFLTGHVFFVADPDIDFGRRNSAADYTRNLQLRAHAKRRDGLFQQLGRNSGIDQGAEKHIAADAGKAFKVCDSHG